MGLAHKKIAGNVAPSVLETKIKKFHLKINKANNVFHDGIGLEGLWFMLHGDQFMVIIMVIIMVINGDLK